MRRASAASIAVCSTISQVPGVSAAGASTGLPLGVRDLRVFTIEQESPATRTAAQRRPGVCRGRYFEALGIPLKRGRYLGAEDAAASEPVAVINETMARRFWGTSDPIGQRIAGSESQHGPWMRIVGVVGDVKQGALNTETISQTYVPWMQVSDGMIADNVVGIMRSLRVALRGEVEPTALTDTTRADSQSIPPCR